MKKLALFIAGLAIVPAMFAASAFADSPGQLSSGDDNYKVKNVTQNSAYGKSASLACNETVKYSILMTNSDFGQLKDVTVKASLPNNISVSAVNADNQTTSVAGTVAISMPSNGTLSYVAGSTNYYVYNSDGTTKSSKTIADGVAAGGINTGTLAGSTQARVYFQAKVNCPEAPKHITVCELATKKIVTINEKDFDASKHSKDLADCAAKPPVEGEITVCELATKKVVTIKESAYDSSKHSKDLADCNVTPVTPVTPTTPTELPQTGATGLAAIVATIATAGAGYLVTARKNLLG